MCSNACVCVCGWLPLPPRGFCFCVCVVCVHNVILYTFAHYSTIIHPTSFPLGIWCVLCISILELTLNSKTCLYALKFYKLSPLGNLFPYHDHGFKFRELEPRKSSSKTPYIHTFIHTHSHVHLYVCLYVHIHSYIFIYI